MENSGLHIYPSSFEYESRMLKITKSLIDAEIIHKAYVAAIWRQGLSEHEAIDENREVWRIPLSVGGFQSGLLIKGIAFLLWQVKIFFHFFPKGLKFVTCHSLSTLPIGIALKLFSGSKLVYDAREFETETAGTSGIRKAIFKLIEKVSVPFVDAVITVNQSIAKWYETEYHLKHVTAVRNIPYRQIHNLHVRENILKKELGLRSEDILFIYQGGLVPARFIEPLLNLFSLENDSKHIVFMGYGPLENQIREFSSRCSNIHFHEAVSPDIVHRYTLGADVGISLIENTCLSYYLSLPNKVFEYIMCGLPILVSDFPEMARIVDESGCGWKVKLEEADLSSLISAISWEDIHIKQDCALRYRESVGWEREEEKLLEVYRNLGGRTGQMQDLNR